VSKDDGEADNEYAIELDHGIEDHKCPRQRDVSATLNVPGLIRPTQM